MKVFFHLYKRYSDIAAAEALALTHGTKKHLLGGEILVANAKKTAFARLGLAHAAYEHLFTCTRSELPARIKRTNFQQHYKTSFKVTAHHTTPAAERGIAQQVAARIRNGKANMHKPATWFHFFFINGNVIAGKLLWQNTEDFESRKVHRWPAPHPTGTHPQLARAMINLTGIQNGELLDPFCGAGGTLIEAGLMGLKPVGYDIEPELLVKAMKNLHGYGIRNYKIATKDACELDGKAAYVVADLPYGRNTNPHGLDQLYRVFLHRLKTTLTKRAVLGFPSDIAYLPLLKEAKLNIIAEYDWEINRNLTKKIVVVSA
jgi:tRNA (guanine10-N2)-dimethyltransferase